MLPLRRDRSADHPRILLLEKAFWSLVIATLCLLIGGLMLSPAELLSSSTFVALFAALGGLWLLHATQVHRHREEYRHDATVHRQRERRGF